METKNQEFKGYEFTDLEMGQEWNRVFFAYNLKEALEIAKEEISKNKKGTFGIRRVYWNGKTGRWIYFNK